MKHCITSFLALLALLLATAAVLQAQSKWVVPEEMKAYSSFIKVPVFPMALKEDPSLPRVLIIGDSISMYYTAEVRHLLAGKANVFRIPDNGKNTGYGLKNIDYWLGDGHWALIHFNFGLHDIVVMPATGKEQVSLEDYERNLRQLLKPLQASGAKLIWASTTPVPEGTPARSEADAIAYNAVARKVMDENHVPIDDLHAFVEAHLDKIERWQYPKNVHFRAEGCVELAAQVAQYIQAALGK
jgi:acyl-CoA thioesterase-1